MPLINKLLVANRAEIARRIMRCCRNLGIGTVAVYSEADRHLAHVHEADCAVCIGSPPAESSYLHAEAIIDAARSSGADAVHPGYGFLAENAAFARAVIDAGLLWVGPPPEAIAAMGDKSRARTLAARCDLPLVPGFDGDGDEAPPTDAQIIAAADGVGFPLLVKAVAGGGGRGMRRVDTADELPAALTSARREAEAAFGDGRLFLEKLLDRPRHIEVQVLADSHGSVLHLFERECSIQRRHQKIVEEAPSPAVSPELRAQLGAAAVRIATEVGYVGAGTVEFLLGGDGRFYFLEMNTRLQVEHPVTEMITGLDLVSLQLSIAEGEALAFGQQDLDIDGHAIEVRLYAEDPQRDYLPASGKLLRVDLPDHGEGLRVDAGYRCGDEVTVHYDPMLAKLIAWGDDRQLCLRRLRRMVERAWVPGVATNLPLLRSILACPQFAAGETTTAFIEQHDLVAAPPLNLRRGTIAAVVLGWALRQRRRPAASAATPGWRLEGPGTFVDHYRSGAEELVASWQTLPNGQLRLTLGEGEDQSGHTVSDIALSPTELRFELDGITRSCRIARSGSSPVIEEGEVIYLHLGDGEAVVSLQPRFPQRHAVDDDPGSCVASTPGNVVAIHVAPGDRVTSGDKLVTLEAMKMEHLATAPASGLVNAVLVAVGDQVDQGVVLVRLDPDAPASEDDGQPEGARS